MRTLQLPTFGSAAASLLCLLSAAYVFSTAYAGFAARSGDLDGLLSAAEITPADASLWQRAGLKIVDSEPARARKYLHRALELNPRDSEALLGLAFISEKSGQIGRAEAYYRSARSVSRRFQPNYALAAFYLRHNRESMFWGPASVAVAMPNSDPQRVFRLAHQITPEPRRIPALLKLESQHALAAYLTFLMQHRQFDSLADIGEKIEPIGANEQLLLNACDTLLSAGMTADAARLWNRLAISANPAFNRLDANTGNVLTNGGFLPAPMRGFNWRSYSTPEVSVQIIEPSGMQIDFSGKQPEAAGIINQPVWLLPHRNYRFAYRSDVSELDSSDGLQWSLLAGGQLVAIAPWRGPQGSFDFQAPDEPSFLLLRYERSAGTVRLRGSIKLLSADLKEIP